MREIYDWASEPDESDSPQRRKQKQELGQFRARDEAVHRRELAAYRRRRRQRRQLLIISAALVLIVAVAVGVAALAGHHGDSGAPGEGQQDGSPDGAQAPDDGGTGAVTAAPPPENGGGEEPNGGGESEEPGGSAMPKDVVMPDWVTEDLIPINPYSRPDIELTVVDAIVVHYVGNPDTTAKQNRNYFADLAVTHETSASAHFVVGMDGEILQLIPVDEVAYCSGPTANYHTLSIETCHPDATGEFTEATLHSLAMLVRFLCDTYNLDRDDVIRHYDVTEKICPKYYVDHPEAWEAFKDLVFSDEIGIDAGVKEPEKVWTLE